MKMRRLSYYVSNISRVLRECHRPKIQGSEFGYSHMRKGEEQRERIMLVGESRLPFFHTRFIIHISPISVLVNISRVNALCYARLITPKTEFLRKRGNSGIYTFLTMILRYAFGFTLLWILIICSRSDGYRIGIGIADVTGPAAEVPFMGYANINQKGQGIHLRQFSRAYIIDDGKTKIVFVNVDVGMIGHGLRKQVLKELQAKYGSEYTVNNIMLSATHTHSAPGGFLMDFLFDISTLGFVRDTFDVLVNGIVRSIARAHENQKEGRIFISKGELLDANINRSPTAYLRNPEVERKRYKYDTDKMMVMMKFKDTKGTSLGMICWYAVHPTSLNYTNKLISSDNVGYASILFEKRMNPPGSLIGKGPFVAAFASTNLGDVSPNTKGAKCQQTGRECDVDTSKCENDLCIASGPGRDMFESTKIIAEKLFYKAVELWKSNAGTIELKGNIRTVHQFIDMPSAEVEYEDPATGEKFKVHGCLPAMGHSFAAGTTDGPGLSAFMQGEIMAHNPPWSYLTNAISPPSENQTACHGIKPILLTTGEMNFPFQWQPEIVSTQLVAFGKDTVMACVPAEFTTMSGRRLRNVLKNELSLKSEDDVIIAGLCNMYSDYVTTPEEYQAQRYEGASTIYGPHTLTIYLKQFSKLAAYIKNNAEDNSIDAGPEPPDSPSNLISFLPPVMFDNYPWGSKFGDCIKQPPSSVRIGDIVSVKFISGHPRNNLRSEDTFLMVERLGSNKNWSVVLTDANWDTQFIWERTSLLLGNSRVEIRWIIGPDTPPGYYRIRHFGDYKSLYDRSTINSYVGVTQVFKVTK